MTKYLKVFWRSVRLSTMKFLAYSTHFLLGLITSFVYGLMNLIFFWLVFEAGGVSEIAGFSVHEVYFVFAITQLIYVLTVIFFFESANMFRYHIHQGWLDMLMTKPISTVFYSMFERLHYFASLSVFLYVIVIFYYSVPYLSVEWNVGNILKLGLIVVVGWLIFSILIWISSLMWLFLPRFRILRMVVTNSFDFNKNPPKVYPGALQWFLSIILPVLLIGNQTYYWLRGEYGWQMILRDLGILVIFILIYILMWKGGLKKYNSAN